jgi:hypothetical protein
MNSLSRARFLPGTGGLRVRTSTSPVVRAGYTCVYTGGGGRSRIPGRNAMKKAMTLAALFALAAIPLLMLSKRREPVPLPPHQVESDNIFENELSVD